MDGTGLSLIKCFKNVEDPRVDRTKLHTLIYIIVMAICAVVAGADSFDAIEVFATAHEQWFRRLLELPNGVPSQDTFERASALQNLRRTKWQKQGKVLVVHFFGEHQFSSPQKDGVHGQV